MAWTEVAVDELEHGHGLGFLIFTTGLLNVEFCTAAWSLLPNSNLAPYPAIASITLCVVVRKLRPFFKSEAPVLCALQLTHAAIIGAQVASFERFR